MDQKPIAAIADRDLYFSRLLAEELSQLGLQVFHAKVETPRDVEDIVARADWLFVDVSENPTSLGAVLNTRVTVVVMGWDGEASNPYRNLAPNSLYLSKADLKTPAVLKSLLAHPSR